jgi:hypothetical protein
MLWLLIGVIMVAIIWALVSASAGKAKATTIGTFDEPPPLPEAVEPILPKVQNWAEGSKTSVSKNFGRGGLPVGVASDSKGMMSKKADEDDWMKKAKPFEPRATKLDLDQPIEEV